MKGFLAIARREILERRLVFVTAALASLIPLAMPLLRGRAGAADARTGTAFVISVAFAIGLCIGLGVSMIAPAMASRRIAFDFARPVGSLAIWGGRLAAACVLALVSAGIVWIPSRLAGGRIPWRDLFVDLELPRLWPLLLLGVLLAVIAASHAASVALRSGSALVALDAALALAAGLGLAAALSRLPAFLAPGPRAFTGWGFALVAVLGLLAGGFASVARGRTDIRAAHRALSLTAWAFVAVGVAGAIAYASWVRAATPRDLAARGFWVTPAPAGTWAKVEGYAREARANFLYNTASGRSERALVMEWRGPAISLDGNRAAWVEARSGGGPFEILALALDEPRAKARRTRLFLEGYPSLFILSADGSRLATIENGALSIHDVAQGRTLASARVSEGRDDVRGFFVGNDLFRVYRQPEASGGSKRLEILELDVSAKKLSPTGELASGGAFHFMADRAGDRVLSVRDADRQTRLLDGRTGAVLSTLAEGESETSRSAGFLSDGRIILAEASAQGARRLRVFPPNGAEERVISLPPGRSISPGGEAAPGQLVVALGDGVKAASYVVGIDDAAVRKLADDLSPAAHLGGFSYEVNAAPAPGSEATKLFIENGRRLVRLDPLTGERRVILGNRDRR